MRSTWVGWWRCGRRGADARPAGGCAPWPTPSATPSRTGCGPEHEQPGPGPLQALAAHRRLVGLLGSFRWHAVLDAREQGASWDDIARVLDEPVDAVRADFLRIVKGQERLTGVGLQTDHARARAALEGDPR